MRKTIVVTILSVIVVLSFFVLEKMNKKVPENSYTAAGECLTGAFLADAPKAGDIYKFKEDYGKKPYYVLIFVEWGGFPDLGAMKAILDSGCAPVVTWEPWIASSKGPIDYEGLLNGQYDEYIKEFASMLGKMPGTVFMRFAHEMNGNWYPWSGSSIGPDKYREMYKYVKDIFDSAGIKNVRWIFSINAEDVPSIKGNEFLNYYPGDSYVDYVGIDGYNWGTTQSWSKWRSFGDIFLKAYNKAVEGIDKPVIISEFGTTSSGGDKAEWIEEALRNMKNMKKVKGFILFNENKETDWKFDPAGSDGKALRKGIKDNYFSDKRGK